MEVYGMLKKIAGVLVVQAVLYLILFIILPKVHGSHPADSNSHILTISVTTVMVSLIGICLLVDQISYWSLGVMVLWALIMIYHPMYAYGLGYRDAFGLSANFPLPLSIFGIAVYVFFIQSMLCLGKSGVQKLIR
jgi:hypothetical protein